MKLKIKLLAILLSIGLFSCSVEDDVPTPDQIDVERTVFVYMPWSTNLLGAFETNLKALQQSIVKNRIRSDRFVVFLAQSQTKAELFELKYAGDKCDTIPLKSYSNPEFTTADGLSGIITDALTFCPAPKYSMIVGSHGLGWITVESRWKSRAAMKFHWDNLDENGVSLTRLFGGLTAESQTDITTLTAAVKKAGVKWEYLLFDDCYMSCVEVAYEFKDITDHLIGCPTEVMFYGFPYDLVGEHLTGKVDYEGVVEAFYQFYSNYSTPCGTIAVTVCSEMDNLAAIMKEINRQFEFNESLRDQIQMMDGYRPVVFFDYGDYVSKLCPDNELLAEFNAQLELTVPCRYKRHTPEYFTSLTGGDRIQINTYSGLTISDPSINNLASDKTETAWYKATH